MLAVKNLRLPNGKSATLELAPRLYFLAGPNGVGKSLLLRTLAGLVPALSDAHLFQGRPAALMAPSAYRRDVMYVPPIPPETEGSVGSYWGLPWTFKAQHGRPTPPLPPEFDPTLPLAQLSSGQKQMLQLKRALALAPKVLLLDEPTAHMDADNSRAAQELVRADQAARGGCVVWVGHDPGAVERLGGKTVPFADWVSA